MQRILVGSFPRISVTKWPSEDVVNFKIQTDFHLDHNRPDILVLENKERVRYITDIACLFDMRALEK